MVLSHWGLSESPFRGALDPRFFYPAPTHDEALARLNFLADERRSLGLLLGESGVGKSLLLEVFRRQLGYTGRQAARLNLLGVSPREMLWQLAGQWGLNPGGEQSEAVLWRALADAIAANRCQQLTSVVLLDDADEASPAVLAQIARLAQLDSAADARLTLVLAAQLGRLQKLGARLLELAELRIDVDSWQESDTTAFVQLALEEAGRAEPVFTDSAAVRLHQLAGGVPRRVKQLADLALLAGAGEQLPQVDDDTVEAVFYELGVVTMLG